MGEAATSQLSVRRCFICSFAEELKYGVTHTAYIGLTQTTHIGVTHTVSEYINE